MKTKLKSITIILFLVLILLSILGYPKETIDSVLFGVNIWAYNVFPSLFPFFVLSDLLVNYGFIEFLSEIFKKVMTVFGLSGECSFPLLGSLVSGFPSGPKYTKQLLDNGSISVDEANFLIMFTHFSNPLFIMGTIGMVLLKNKTLGMIILSAHFLGNFIIGIVFRKKKKQSINKISFRKAINDMNKKRINNDKNFIKILSDAIYSGIDVLILLLGIIIIFLIFTNCINRLFLFDEKTMILIKGILEMTQGVKYAASSNLSLLTKTMFITFFLSFGGFSVHMQVGSIINGSKIKYKNFLIARIIHAIISVILVSILFNIFII